MAKTKKRNAADITDRRLKPIYRDIDALTIAVVNIKNDIKRLNGAVAELARNLAALATYARR